jgi:hypothetical protein
VVTDRSLGEAERLGQVADAGLALRLRLDQAEQSPCRIGQHLQRTRELVSLVGAA